MIRQILFLHMMIMVCGALLDQAIGDPAWFPHPVRGMGRLISFTERTLYKEESTSSGKRFRGGMLVLVVTLCCTGLAVAVSALLFFIDTKLYVMFGILLSGLLVAERSLKQAARDVMVPLEKGNTEGARHAVSMIVGRDTSVLDEAGITRAAIETVAENTSDGVIAPLFYGVLFGPAGCVWYKAVNTMDSMIGYHNERYKDFGCVAARLDDVCNFLPARISAVLMIAAAFVLHMDGKGAARVFVRDRYRSKSPNAGQCESVCAGALNVQLMGDAVYFGKKVKKPTIGDNLRPVEPEDIERSCRLMDATTVLFLVLFSLPVFLGYFLWNR